MKLLRPAIHLLPKVLRHGCYRALVRVGDSAPNLSFKLAETKEELGAAFRVLHDSYVSMGFMPPHPSGMRITFHHTLPYTQMLIALWDGEVIGTVSVIQDNEFGLPIDKIFDTANVKAGGHRAAEISALALKKEYSGNRGEILFALFKFLYQYCVNHLELDRLMIAIHPDQTDFYEALFFFQHIQDKEAGTYDYVNGAPADGLYLDLKEAYRLVATNYGKKRDVKNLFKYFILPSKNFKFPDRTDASTQSLANYEGLMTTARHRFLARTTAFFYEKDPNVLGLFLIYFCSQGVGMTELVSDWICRAGKNTAKKGFEELGKALMDHASQEAGHHKMMINDTQSLIGWWNDRTSPKLKSDTFLSAGWSPGVESYRKLHENYIAGETPYCQIAIEYEIEKISVDFGPKLFSHLTKILGSDILQCLSFIKEHVALDIGHTQYNARALEKFINHTPKAVYPLVTAGASALDRYATYLEDCFESAKEF